MRVLFLTLYPDVAASPRYRVAQFLPHLETHGVECAVACPLTADEWRAFTGPGRRRRAFWYHAAELRRRLGQVLRARRYDVVFVQKGIMSAYVRGAAALLRWRARRIVYDFDDAVHLAPPHPLRRPWNLLEDRAQVAKVMAMADLVLAGNNWLKSEAEKHGAKAVHFPTVVDTARFSPCGDAPATYRVGWIGNPSTMVCLEPVAEVLGSLPDADVCLVGADAARAPWPNVEVRPWSLATEVDELRSFSVGIMPQPSGEWMKGKCGLKALQYMACGIPCVVSPGGAADEFIRHDENGLVADRPQAWREAFDRLRDPALRRRLGEAGRATVVERYSLAKAAPRLLALLETVA